MKIKNEKQRISVYESGDKYGSVLLTGKCYMQKIKNGSRRIVEYICKCGKIGWTRLGCLKNGHTSSCGCHHIEKVTTQYGLSRHPLMNVWVGIIRRCYDKKCKHYKSYGARGVTVCDEWRNNYKSFYDWSIANGWRDDLELDKDKLSYTQTGIIYSPNFCCFITHKENSLYTSRSRIIEYKGERKNLSEWCKELGLRYSSMLQRISRDNLDATKAFQTPLRQFKNISNALS